MGIQPENKEDMGWPSCFGERGPNNFIFLKDFYTFPTNDVVYIIFWPWEAYETF